MVNYLLRAEGVNLSNILNDTDQLSVIRGSGLILRDSVKRLLKQLNDKYQVDTSNVEDFEEVARDASSVLIQYKAKSDDVAEDIMSNSVNFFCDEYSDFTFVLDWMRASDDFKADQDKLTAANRLRQLQQPSLAIPAWNTSTPTPILDVKDPIVCEASGVYPSDGKVIAGEQLVSNSVERRFSRGRKLRRYKEELGDAFDDAFKFTDDLQSLADSSHYGNLNNKIAVIYFDGNSFGSLQRSIVKTADDKTKFDRCITKKHRQFLIAQIQATQQDKAYQTLQEEIRMETLLWGGDEIMLVVPAWKGFDTLMRFYETVDKMSYMNLPLTYAGGLVFSQAKTPIYRLTSLAKQLAESVKAQLKSDNNSMQNQFDYLVLESMDYPSSSIEELHQRMYGVKSDKRNCLAPIDRSGFEALGHILRDLQFPVSKLVELVNTYLSEGEDAALVVKQRIETVIGEQSMQRVESHILKLFKQDDPFWNWVHLVECRDYLLTEQEMRK